jgi:CheY-like chemotaxis protein
MASGRLRGVRVLVLDDDDEVRRQALVALTAEEADVTPVATVASALAFVCLLHPDVVVADLDIADDGGWRLLQALRKTEREATVPVVATSRSSDDGDAALHGGFAAFVRKPFDVEALRATVARVAVAAAALNA